MRSRSMCALVVGFAACSSASPPPAQPVPPPCDPAAKPPKAKAQAPATTTVDALDCFVEGFKEPMPFGPTPGIEYVADGVYAGYRSL